MPALALGMKARKQQEGGEPLISQRIPGSV